jgi:hypothetical protein
LAASSSCTPSGTDQLGIAPQHQSSWACACAKDPNSFAVMAIGARLAAPYTSNFDPTHRLTTSWILSPVLLFCFRAFLALYAFLTLFTIFGWNGSHGMSAASRHSFSFFTNLTYWGLAFYYAFAAIHTGSYCFTGVSFLSRWPRALQIAHSMYYSTVVVYPFIVTSKFTTLPPNQHDAHKFLP